MDITKLLAVPQSLDSQDILSLQEENLRLRRLLAFTARSYNSAKKELEFTKEALGHYRHPLRFLEFPREVRDHIYYYALVTGHVSTEQRPVAWLAIDDQQMKPETPNLCLVSKQLYDEGREVLYSKNSFCFERPSHLLHFEEQIGSANRDLVRHIEITTTSYLPRNPLLIDPNFIAPCDYQAFHTHWAKALSSSKLSSLNEMVVVNYPSQNWSCPIDTMAECLQTAIMELFARIKDPQFRPRLTLKGFEKNELRKFPRHWNIIRTITGSDVAESTINFKSAVYSDQTHFGSLGHDGAGDFDRSGEWDINSSNSGTQFVFPERT